MTLLRRRKGKMIQHLEWDKCITPTETGYGTIPHEIWMQKEAARITRNKNRKAEVKYRNNGTQCCLFVNDQYETFRDHNERLKRGVEIGSCGKIGTRTKTL